MTEREQEYLGKILKYEQCICDIVDFIPSKFLIDGLERKEDIEMKKNRKNIVITVINRY